MSDLEHNSGTLPMPEDSAPEPAAPVISLPQTEKKGRRVGTITMALSLIATGIVFLLWAIFPSFDWVTALRFSPAVLIFLGVEILICNFRHNAEKLRYDFLSVFVCLLLICGSLLGAVVPQQIFENNYLYSVGNTLSARLDEQAFTLLQNEPNIATVQFSVSPAYRPAASSPASVELSAEDYVQVRIEFNGEFPDAQSFALTCHRVLNILKTQIPTIQYASFHSNYLVDLYYTTYFTDEVYSLWLDGIYQMNWSAADMERNLTVYHWYAPEGCYLTPWEYDDRLRHPDYYGEDDGMDDIAPLPDEEPSTEDDPSVFVSPSSIPEPEEDISS